MCCTVPLIRGGCDAPSGGKETGRILAPPVGPRPGGGPKGRAVLRELGLRSLKPAPELAWWGWCPWERAAGGWRLRSSGAPRFPGGGGGGRHAQELVPRGLTFSEHSLAFHAPHERGSVTTAPARRGSAARPGHVIISLTPLFVPESFRSFKCPKYGSK